MGMEEAVVFLSGRQIYVCGNPSPVALYTIKGIAEYDRPEMRELYVFYENVFGPSRIIVLQILTRALPTINKLLLSEQWCT